MKKLFTRISLRRVLTISFVGLIVLSGISITIISYFGSRKLGISMAKTIIQENSRMTIENIENYLSSVYAINKTLSYDIGKLGITNNLLERFRQYLMLYPNITGIYFGREDGSFIFGKRMTDGSISFREIIIYEDRVESKWTHENSNYFLSGFNNEVLSINEGYDPRYREWYLSAKKTQNNYWSDIYLFSSDKLPGITNSEPVFDNENNLIGVTGIDLGIITFSHYLNKLDISEKGKIIILNSNKNIIAHSYTQEDGTSSLKKMVTINEFPDKVVRLSYTSPSSFTVDGRRFISEYKSFSLDSLIKLEIGIIIPEEEILKPLYKTNRIILLTAIGFILLATVIGLSLAKRISKPLTLISKSMGKIRRFQLDDSLKIESELKEVQDIHNSYANLRNGLISFSKYVPSSVVAKLIKLGKEAVLGGERRKVTIFFSDIQGFTEISESMEPEQLVDELAVYLGKLSSIVQSNRGTVDKYIGDSIMSFWNAPERIENHAYLACKVALDIMKYLKNLKKEQPFGTHFPTRIGINTGDVLVGNIGSSERMNYTVMGDNINLGSRLESLNKYYGTKILVTQETAKEAGTSFSFRPIDRVRVKGKTKPIFIYELVGYIKELSDSRIKLNSLYEVGLDYYFKSQWNESLKYFEKCLELFPYDSPTIKIIERINSYIISPPARDWGGVYIYLDK